MHSVDLSLYMYFYHFGSESVALSMYLRISVKYSYLYPVVKYGVNNPFSFGYGQRRSYPVYSFGSIPALFLCVVWYVLRVLLPVP